MNQFKLLDPVRLLEDIPNVGLKKGQTGTIIFEFMEPNIAYEVEFSNEDGCAIAQLPLLPSQIDHLES